MLIKSILLEKCLAKDERSIHELYRLCFSMMKSISMRYQQNEADVNEAINLGFLKVIQNLHTYNNSNSFEGWYKRILVNTNIDIYRKSKRHQERILYVEVLDEHNIPSNEISAPNVKYSYDSLLNLIKNLPPMTRQVFNLFAIDGYAHKEIAEILKISPGTSKWHVSDARKKLRSMLVEKSNPEIVAK